MADVKNIYQSNIDTDSPELQAKKMALQEAFIPEELNFIFSQSSVSVLYEDSESEETFPSQSKKSSNQ